MILRVLRPFGGRDFWVELTAGQFAYLPDEPFLITSTADGPLVSVDLPGVQAVYTLTTNPEADRVLDWFGATPLCQQAVDLVRLYRRHGGRVQLDLQDTAS